MDLKGAVTMVTGGARGLGRAIAEAFVKRGAKVAIIDLLKDELLHTAKEMKSGGAMVLPVVTDVTIGSQVEEMVAQVKEKLGPIDILVNCAGSLSAIGPVWEVDPERWFRDVTVNLYGTFLCCHAVIKDMIERKFGYILNMVGGGVGDPHTYTTGYACSKTGVMRLTEGLAIEAAPSEVKVFAMQPGPVLTAMTKFIMESPEGKKWRPTFSKIFEEGRDAPAALIAKLAVHLVSGKADRLTGRYFDARWDFEAIVKETDSILHDDRLTLRLLK
jgi:NAD(P)-dependent dehydrogenase (short-subunit alcohol dehydrogenase family)